MFVYLLLLLPISIESANLFVFNEDTVKQMKVDDDVVDGVINNILFHHNVKKVIKKIEEIELIAKAFSKDKSELLRSGLNSIIKVLKEAKEIELKEPVQFKKRKEDLREGFEKLEPQYQINKQTRFKIISDRDYNKKGKEKIKKCKNEDKD